MLQCVREKLKTADEKLRNIGKQQPQSATVVQTQNFTYVKHLHKTQDDSRRQPTHQQQQQQQQQQQEQQQQQKQQQQNQQLQQQQQQQQQQHQQFQQQQKEEAAARSSYQNVSDPETEKMAERAILRQGRRERNGFRAAEDQERSEIKRRSRSEGPNRRVRQSMDEREGGKKLIYDGGGRGGRRLPDSSDSDDSDRTPPRQTLGCAGGFDSSSDSDPKRWTKNPLVVRRVKRPDKVRQQEKRLSGTENGVNAKNRDSWVYYGNEDASSGSLGGGNSSSKDGGSGGKGSKYQRLEEMRKKRINLSVTSDEETTPASRISRLRQRAIQSGLGEQARSSNTQNVSAPASEIAQWGAAQRQQQQLQQSRIQQQLQQQTHQAQSYVSSGPGGRKFPVSGSGQEPSRPAPPARPMYGPKITPVTQPPSFASQSYSQPQHVRPASQAIQPLAKNVATTDLGRSFSQQPSYLQQKQPQQSPGQKQAPARPPPPNVQTARQPFHTIPEPALQNTRALHSSSPEVQNRRYTTQVHMPSSDPVHTTGPQPVLATRSAKEPMTLSQTPLHIQARANPPMGQGVSRSAGASRSPSQFNDVVEMRLKSSRDDRPRSQQKIPKKMAPKSSLLGNSDDSLDELIESNIQYLDTEIDRGKAKRNSGINVSRSSSLPDPRRISGHVSSAPSLHEQQPSIQVQASTSIQFHVSLPTDSFHSANHMATPVIQIAPSSTMGYQSNYGYINNSQLRTQPDVVPRKYSYDSHSRLSRPSSEYYDKDDLSKSDSQLNAQVVVPSYLSNSLHPDQAYARGCVSDLNLRSSTGMGNTLQSPQMDKGMFSDVEYDIEVSERVKKWETKMKQDIQVGGDKKNLNLTTIDENEGEPLMLPSEVRKSVLLNKGDFGSPYQQDVTYTPPTRPRPFSSDTSIHRVGEAGGPKVFSLETNAHRFFQVIQDPQSGPRLGIQSQSVSSVFQTPVTIRPEKTFLSASELRQQMLSNRQPALPSTSGPMPATYQPALPHASSYQSTPQKDSLVVKRPSTLTDVRDASKRGSRYKEELDEISSVKTDSVVNLRRRFDTDSATVTSEDDQKSVSVASTKLKRPSKQSPSHKDSDVDVSKMLPRYQQKFKDSDVWSPNLESTQGVPVSIERVTARTLQTIPFSEDPFWKEIEEMTSFDPASMAGHLSVSSTQDTPVNLEPVRSQHQVELSAPHSSTLPNQPRNNVMSARERMQRSKSLYTPNITPLSINVNDKSSSSAVSALDDVLDDISRSSMERKQMSPKKRVMDSDIIASTAAATANAPSFRFEGGQFTFTKPTVPTQPQPAKPYDSGKQPLQFYQQQRHHQQQQQQPNRQSQMLPGGVNNYQLDPDLLKQKLLSTGLVVETDTEEAAPEQHQYRRSSLGATPTGFKPFSTAGTSYTTITTQSNTANLRPGDIRKMASTFTPLQSNAPSVVTTTMSTAGPVKTSGTSALDDIQKALAPFTTAYQPGPESLYGTARFESFKEPSLDTSRGPNTKPTGWAYQPQLGRDQEGIRSNDGSLSSTSTSTLQQVNESMDDLKDLAQNVERRINVIRSKLQAADERSLDSILTSLRKLNPEAKPQDSEPSSFEDYYTVKKSKLSAALSELDRIYDSLELNSEGLSRPTERGKYKPYRHSKSSDYILGPQVKSEHVQPSQTKISSFFIPNLEDRTRKELDKETESEFDVLSKSFQAIIDEVNQTTDLFTRAAERNKQENTAPETQKQTFKITLKPGETVAGSMSSTKPLGSDDTATATPYKAAPATAPKPQDRSKGGRFRSKLPEATADDDVSSTKPRSKSVPGMDSNTAELLGSALQKAANASVVPKSTVSSTTTVTASTAPAPASTPPPATRQRTRVRPVRDNRIIQDDRAARRDSSEKVLGMPPSPQPSPKVSRKIIYNSGVDLDVKLQPPEMFQDAPGKPTQEPPLNQPQPGSGAKLQAQMAEDRFIYKPPEADIKPASVASPSSVKKIPPPTAAKPSIKTEISVPAPSSPTRASAPVPLPGKSEPEQTTTGGRKLLVSDSSVSSGLNLSSSASTASINLSPPVFDSNQPKPLLASPKHDVQDSESSSSGGRKSKRRLGMGVAMMLDKFNTEDGGDKLKKRLGTRSAPDLTGNVNEEDKDGDDEANTKSTEQTGPKVATVVKTEAQLSPSHLKSPTGKAEEKSPPVFVIDSKNVTPVAKSAVISSLERKVIDPEGRAPSSGTSSPQPSSPCSKPPHHPWKRQTSDPDKQSVSDAIESSSSMGVGSPTMVSKITKTIGSPPPVTATLVSDDGPATSGAVTPSQEPESPRSAAKRIRPPERKIQTGSGAATERPHSFHELFSCFERDPNKLESMDKFRRSASADAVNCGATGDKVFRSERNISHKVKPGDGHKDSEVVFKFALKVKS